MRIKRLRRLREKAALRNWISQTQLHPKDIILPYFVVEGKRVKQAIKSMPGVYHLSIDNLVKDIPQALGIKSILLFGIPKYKDELGTSSYKRDGIVQKAIRSIKKEFKDLIIITDVCLCAYTTHGHCGIIKNLPPRHKKFSRRDPAEMKKTRRGGKKYTIDNDETIKILAKVALSHADAGADLVAPSAMMDGQVGAIRNALDRRGFKDVGIVGYSAKYASSFYGPFREALDSSPLFGDRKGYQMDFRNSDEALREIKEDIDEGADIVMVKPALAYLDIIYRAKEKFNVPIAAYNVSGEYYMIQSLAGGDKLKEKELALEALTSIKRAGADLIISYFGKDIGRWLRK